MLTKKDIRPEGLAVAPTLSSVVSFTLGPTGTLLASSVAVSSLSSEADTSILAAIQTAAANRAFPSMPAAASGPPSLRFDVIVSTTLPDSTQHAVVVDKITIPEWPLTRPVALAPGDQPAFASMRTDATAPPDSAKFEFVVDETGRAIPSTVRAISRSGRLSDPTYLEFVARVAQTLPSYRFAPALVGACPVRQVTSQLFSD